MANPRPPRNRMWIALLSLGGAFLAFYLVAGNLGWTGPVQCGAGDCGTVQASRYAWIGPVPVSAIGLGGYVALLALALVGLQPAFANSRLVAGLLFGGALTGLLFSAYLTYLEAFVIEAWCRYCVASAVLITFVLLTSLPEFKRMRGIPMSTTHKMVELIFGQEGRFHSQAVNVPWAGRNNYDKLIDFLANDPAVQRECYINFKDVCSASVLDK